MFDDLGIVGLSWRSSAVEALEGFALPEDEANEKIERFAARNGLTEVAYLSTCNRVELIFARGPDSTRELRPEAYTL